MNERRPSYFDSGSQGRLSIRSSYSIDFQSINSFLQLVSTRETSDEPTRGEFSWAEIHRNEIHRRQNYPRKILRGKKKKLLPLSFQGKGERRGVLISSNRARRLDGSTARRRKSRSKIELRASWRVSGKGKRRNESSNDNKCEQPSRGWGGGTQAFSSPGSRKGHHVSTLPPSPFYFRRRGLQANGPALSGNP